MVSTVATSSPPMMVTAIDPQNPERVSGIMARMAASEVSTTGRARRTVESMMAAREVGPDASRHVGRLHAVANVGAHDHGEVAVAAPRDRVLIGLLDSGDLRHRDGHAVARQHRQIADRAELVALALDRAGHHGDLL